MLDAAQLSATNPNSLYKLPTTPLFETSRYAYLGYSVFCRGLNGWAVANWGLPTTPAAPQIGYASVDEVFTSTYTGSLGLYTVMSRHWASKIANITIDLAMIEAAAVNKRRIDTIDSLLVGGTPIDTIAEAYDWQQSPSYECYVTFHESDVIITTIAPYPAAQIETQINAVPVAERLNLSWIIVNAAAQPVMQPYVITTLTELLTALGRLDSTEQNTMITWLAANAGQPTASSRARVTSNMAAMAIANTNITNLGLPELSYFNTLISTETAAYNELRSYLTNSQSLIYINGTSTDPGTKKVIERILNTTNVDYTALAAYNNSGSFQTDDSKALSAVGVSISPTTVDQTIQPKTTLQLVPCSAIVAYSNAELASFQSVINQLDDNLRALKQQAAEWYRTNVVEYKATAQYDQKYMDAKPTVLQPDGTSKDLKVRLEWQVVRDHVVEMQQLFENDFATQISLQVAAYYAAKEELYVRTCYGKYPQQAIDSCNDIEYTVTTILDSTL